MKTWKEMLQESLLLGTKLSKEVIETEDNFKKIYEAITSLKQVADNISHLRTSLTEVANNYNYAKDSIDIVALRKLNSEASFRNKIIDTNFEMTLNALSMKNEWETDKETKERLIKTFSIPLIK